MVAAATSPDAWLTPTMFEETSCVRAADCATLLAISLVAAPCSSTAEAMVVAISCIWRIVPPMFSIADPASPVALWKGAVRALRNLRVVHYKTGTSGACAYRRVERRIEG